MKLLEYIRRGDSEVSDHRKECLNTSQLTSASRTQLTVNATDAFPIPERGSLTNGDQEFDHEIASILEPLSAAPTGREAIRKVLERIVSADSAFAPGTHTRQMIRLQILHRIEGAVYEGELPESTQMEALGNSCTSFLLGLAINRHDGVSAALLMDSIRLFVDALGFHCVRPANRKRRVESKLVPFGQEKDADTGVRCPICPSKGREMHAKKSMIESDRKPRPTALHEPLEPRRLPCPRRDA